MGLRAKLIRLYYSKVKKLSSMQIRIHHLCQCGMSIGEDVWIFFDKIETSESYSVTIGNRVMIAPEVMFITHDASASYYILGASDIFGRINIGNSCFIGMGAIILPGVTIADNCIVGAGSVVTKSFLEPGYVILGNPAKKICTIEQLREKMKSIHLILWKKVFERKSCICFLMKINLKDITINEDMIILFVHYVF